MSILFLLTVRLTMATFVTDGFINVTMTGPSERPDGLEKTLIEKLPYVNHEKVRKRCSLTHWFCFGIKYGAKSFHFDSGCIKEDNCNLMVQGNKVSNERIEWTLWMKRKLAAGKSLEGKMIIREPWRNDPNQINAPTILSFKAYHITWNGSQIVFNSSSKALVNKKGSFDGNAINGLSCNKLRSDCSLFGALSEGTIATDKEHYFTATYISKHALWLRNLPYNFSNYQIDFNKDKIHVSMQLIRGDNVIDQNTMVDGCELFTGKECLYKQDSFQPDLNIGYVPPTTTDRSMVNVTTIITTTVSTKILNASRRTNFKMIGMIIGIILGIILLIIILYLLYTCYLRTESKERRVKNDKKYKDKKDMKHSSLDTMATLDKSTQGFSVSTNEKSTRRADSKMGLKRGMTSRKINNSNDNYANLFKKNTNTITDTSTYDD